MAVSRAVAAYQPEVDGGLSSLYKSVLKRLELAEVSGELKEVIDDSQRQLLNALCEELEQGHLFEDLSASSVLSLLNQIRKFENDYPGGIFSYLRTARRLLSSFLGGESLDSEATSVTIPDCVRAYLEHPDYVKYEEIGLPGLTRCAFVLVAGGLGERLGYPGIKIGIPVEITTETTYIEHFISFILEYQRLGNERTSSHEANDSTSLRSQKLPMKLPLLIMTSEDTHYETAKLLEEKNYFGMDSDQIILAKQEKVPAFCDTQARLCIDPKDSSILMKPHGHGDVHLLLNKLGITQKWLNQGLEHVVLFQDTNALAFRALPALLGVSLMNDFTMNSLVVPRKPMEAVGAICKFSYPDGSTTTVNVEYNILDTLLRSTGRSEAEDIDEDGNSKFPGNSNLLVLKLSRYSEILAKTGGIVPEFVNPKFKNAEKKGSFKSPTRVESMMQDIARLFGASDKIGCTLFERSNAFSPLKNNVADASIKSKSGLAPESAFSAEADFYANGGRLLKFAAERKGCNIKIGAANLETFLGISYPLGPRIVLKPSFGVTIGQIAEKLSASSRISISSSSTLVLDGNVHINGLNLDGALTVSAPKGVVGHLEEDCYIQNKGYEFSPLKVMSSDISKPSEDEDADESKYSNLSYLKIRGYRLKCLDHHEVLLRK